VSNTVTENVDYRRSTSCQEAPSCGKCGSRRLVEFSPVQLALAEGHAHRALAPEAFPADASAALLCWDCEAFAGWVV
jgi:hypothetical protein